MPHRKRWGERQRNEVANLRSHRAYFSCVCVCFVCGFEQNDSRTIWPGSSTSNYVWYRELRLQNTHTHTQSGSQNEEDNNKCYFDSWWSWAYKMVTGTTTATRRCNKRSQTYSRFSIRFSVQILKCGRLSATTQSTGSIWVDLIKLKWKISTIFE